MQREKRATARVKKSIGRRVEALPKQLAEIDRESDAIRGSAIRRRSENLLVSVPGVGPATARRRIAELPELRSLERRQAAALAGLAPFTRPSGPWRGKACLGGGRATGRTALCLAALVAARHHPRRKSFHDRLRAAEKPKKLAHIAVARNASPSATPSSGTTSRGSSLASKHSRAPPRIAPRGE